MIPEYHGRRKVIINGPGEDMGKTEKSIEVSYFYVHSLWNIGNGYFSPCDGFHGPEEIRGILEDNSLPNGTKWSFPIILQIEPNAWENIGNGDVVQLTYENKPIGIMEIYEKFVLDMDWYLTKLFGPKVEKHPYTLPMRKNGEKAISGKILCVLRENFPFVIKSKDTEWVRKKLAESGFQNVCGFQTRNAPHRGHEFLHKMALMNCDSLLLTPSLGPKKEGDLPDDLIVMAYETYIENYLPVGRTLLYPLNYAMMYGGPREAFLHMIMRKNMGCSSFIIGRDHAGVGDLYGQMESREYLKSMGNIGITPVFVDEVFFCRRCDELTTDRICSHSEEYRTRFSGTMIREMIRGQQIPDKNVMREEIYMTIRKGI
ncbi:sulfate adenylyltransferase [Cuniculiplasma sp. SKW3]|uniref:sulfate adenylyltransferase n=1 Tax=unclassified Cuniculiplasma TaxID=2619706 RepID=UPI003FD2C6EA